MKLLLIASDPREFQGLLARCEKARNPGLPLIWSRQARYAAHEFLMVSNGAGATRSAAAVDAAVPVSHPHAVVSMGFCGALAPELGVADIVVGTAIAGGEFQLQVPRNPASHHLGAVCSIDHVARTAAEKGRLRATGAIAVEMEAAGVAARAQVHCLPFFCIKSVTDLAGESMANDFNAALRSDGHFATIDILRSTLRHPWVRLPELFRLRRRCVRATRLLGDFIANCRF
jgi:nucleoside phosphorylase